MMMALPFERRDEFITLSQWGDMVGSIVGGIVDDIVGDTAL